MNQHDPLNEGDGLRIREFLYYGRTFVNASFIQINNIKNIVHIKNENAFKINNVIKDKNQIMDYIETCINKKESILIINELNDSKFLELLQEKYISTPNQTEEFGETNFDLNELMFSNDSNSFFEDNLQKICSPISCVEENQKKRVHETTNDNNESPKKKLNRNPDKKIALMPTKKENLEKNKANIKNTPNKNNNNESKTKVKTITPRITLKHLIDNFFLRPGQTLIFKQIEGTLTFDGKISYKNQVFKSPSKFTDKILRELNYSKKTRVNAWKEITIDGEQIFKIRERYKSKKKKISQNHTPNKENINNKKVDNNLLIPKKDQESDNEGSKESSEDDEENFENITQKTPSKRRNTSPDKYLNDSTISQSLSQSSQKNTRL